MLALAGALGRFVAVPVAAGSASADSTPTPLAMTSFARIVVDQALGHLFQSPGRSGNALTVTDLVGHAGRGEWPDRRGNRDGADS
jgi:hypothetical protein